MAVAKAIGQGLALRRHHRRARHHRDARRQQSTAVYLLSPAEYRTPLALLLEVYVAAALERLEAAVHSWLPRLCASCPAPNASSTGANGDGGGESARGGAHRVKQHSTMPVSGISAAPSGSMRGRPAESSKLYAAPNAETERRLPRVCKIRPAKLQPQRAGGRRFAASGALLSAWSAADTAASPSKAGCPQFEN